MEEYEEGFYHLYTPNEAAPVLVHGYFYQPLNEFIFGFNIHDGGGWVPVSDLKDESRVVKVNITES